MGGVRFDINDDLKKHILSLLNHIKKDFKELTNIMFASSSLLDRLETTGRLSTEIARGLGVVGVAARASGIATDTRIIHPYAAYAEVDFDIPIFHYEGMSLQGCGSGLMRSISLYILLSNVLIRCLRVHQKPRLRRRFHLTDRH